MCAQQAERQKVNEEKRQQQTSRRAVDQYETPKVLTQLLSRVNHALVSSRLDLVDVFPVMLTIC